MDLEKALFAGEVQAVVATTYLNERPLCGLAGILDWRFHGGISRCIQKGVVTGQVGECVYFPVTRHGITHHLILVGAGHTTAPGQRHTLPAASLKAIEQNLMSLRLEKVGLSRSDLGEIHFDSLSQRLKKAGVQVWITS